MKSKLPMIITMGDVNGVGPEITAKLLSLGKKSLIKQQFPVVFGSISALKQASLQFNFNLKLVEIKQLSEWSHHSDEICVFEAGVEGLKIQPGKIDPEVGRAALKWVHEAVLHIRRGEALGMVTAPLSKEAVEPGCKGFQGHTEYIGEMCGDPEPVLALVHDDWVVAHVSTHVSLRQACDRVTKVRVTKTIELLNDLLKKLKSSNSSVAEDFATNSPDLAYTPKIGVAGLNPHAGENGLFGQEEIDVILPVVEELNSRGYEIFGPIPGDVVFPQLKAGRYDGAVAMYHDQGHVVTKTLAFDLGEAKSLRGVNITLGLDLVRTSVDHGTGYDIAWQGIASSESLLDALNLAHRITR